MIAAHVRVGRGDDLHVLDAGHRFRQHHDLRASGRRIDDRLPPLRRDYAGLVTSLAKDEETGLWSYAPLPWERWNGRRRRLEAR